MKVQLNKQDFLMCSPAIYFYTTTKTEQGKLKEHAKDQFAKFYAPVKKSNYSNKEKTEWAFHVFKTETAEDFSKWRI